MKQYKNTVNTSTHITKTPTHTHTHTLQNPSHNFRILFTCSLLNEAINISHYIILWKWLRLNCKYSPHVHGWT